MCGSRCASARQKPISGSEVPPKCRPISVTTGGPSMGLNPDRPVKALRIGAYPRVEVGSGTWAPNRPGSSVDVPPAGVPQAVVASAV
jgi:hypothetical protein